VLEVEVGSMFGRDAPAPPPEDGFLLDSVVKPCLANLLSREIWRVAMLCQCADEDECAGNIVIRDHQRGVDSIMDVVVNMAQFLHDALVCPSLEGSTKVDPTSFLAHRHRPL